ncbi:MAG: tRNA (adenosine(37)-N6)-threonylcarbamoyltransferase complex dimerization subunit type 1 TsaB [Desulfobacterota bacterium]|nr:tRNA (adenosine(37)-N6)-threonylcarbamoyltransferase complex dimerization subunit type 1 TsaB [Thermodesulfobacteriota bacterium]MDW8001439.1 tRNA (adenosine(37)-N6)-threonylcarbamoyltransferase complex dimerization subunit type 1 TsaB [Deltaproteobacteria bacterium]
MENKLVLAIDNSLEYLSIAISAGEEILEERKIKGRESPSQIIAEEVFEMLKKRNLKAQDLGLLVGTTGPGSFTGIRVALGFLKGMKIGLGIPLVGVPTLDCISYAFSFMDGYHILPVLDAKKGEVFCALYFSSRGQLQRLSAYEAKKPEEIKEMLRKPCFVVGSGVPLVSSSLKGEGVILAEKVLRHVPMAVAIRLGLERQKVGSENVVPVYGRRSEAEIKFNLYLT